MFGNGLLSRWLFSTGQEAFALKSAAALAVFNIVGNWIIIPQYGAEGASVMTLATEGLLFLLWIFAGRKAPALLGFWLVLLIPVSLVGWLNLNQNMSVAAFITAAACLAPLLLIHLKRVHTLT